MFVVSDPQHLNWWLRRFAPRVVLRMTPESVEASSSEGFVHARPTLVVAADGANRRILGIGDDPVEHPSAERIAIFDSSSHGVDTSADLVAAFLRVVLKRLPRRWGVIRPVVLVEGIESLHEPLAGRERDVIVQALTASGAVAAVLRGAVDNGR